MSSAGRSLRAWTMDRGDHRCRRRCQGALEFWIRAQPAGRRVGIRDAPAIYASRRQAPDGAIQVANRFFEMKWIVRPSGSSGARSSRRCARPFELSIRRWRSPASRRWHRSFAAISTCSALLTLLLAQCVRHVGDAAGCGRPVRSDRLFCRPAAPRGRRANGAGSHGVMGDAGVRGEGSCSPGWSDC